MTISVPNVTWNQLFNWLNTWSMCCVVITLMFLWYVVISYVINGECNARRFKLLKKFILLFYPYGLFRWFLYGNAINSTFIAVATVVAGFLLFGLIGCFVESFEPQYVKDLRTRNEFLEKELDLKNGVIENYKIVQNELKSKIADRQN